VALVLGAVLTVTGPTVIGRLLREIRPSGKAGIIAKWESIAIDPVGATLAVLVFEAISALRSAHSIQQHQRVRQFVDVADRARQCALQ
jgi:NhaP-type Na+/H+ or K+/H+ antiporter